MKIKYYNRDSVFLKNLPKTLRHITIYLTIKLMMVILFLLLYIQINEGVSILYGFTNAIITSDTVTIVLMFIVWLSYGSEFNENDKLIWKCWFVTTLVILSSMLLFKWYIKTNTDLFNTKLTTFEIKKVDLFISEASLENRCRYNLTAYIDERDKKIDFCLKNYDEYAHIRDNGSDVRIVVKESNLADMVNYELNIHERMKER